MAGIWNDIVCVTIVFHVLNKCRVIVGVVVTETPIRALGIQRQQLGQNRGKLAGCNSSWLSDSKGHVSEMRCDRLQTRYRWVEAIDIPLVGINHAIERTKHGSRA